MIQTFDGDNRTEVVGRDWENTQACYTKFALFGDYDAKGTSGTKPVIDAIKAHKELIIGDRRIFLDDRQIPDDKINYGQVLVQHPDFDSSDYMDEW
jgi:hypothetical protein